MPIVIDATGNFENTRRYLQRLTRADVFNILDKYGPQGVAALSAATPVRTGRTAQSWTYEIRTTHGNHEIVWKNEHVEKGANIALLIHYGHGTRTGGYVPGHPYINQALAPIFAKILEEVRRVVKA